jgi:hypothetical protein
LPCRGRNAGPIAPCWVLDPELGKIKPHVDGCVVCAVRQDGKSRDLTVVDLAQPARPLSRHTDRPMAVFWEARFVKDQAAVCLAAEKAVGIHPDLRHHRFVTPWQND